MAFFGTLQDVLNTSSGLVLCCEFCVVTFVWLIALKIALLTKIKCRKKIVRVCICACDYVGDFVNFWMPLYVGCCVRVKQVSHLKWSSYSTSK